MTLRVYVRNQLSKIKVEQVTVKIDTENEMKSYPGTVSWIASSAEFTKIIQTKEERESGVCRKNKCEK
jgi:HlyD family secretion protein